MSEGQKPTLVRTTEAVPGNTEPRATWRDRIKQRIARFNEWLNKEPEPVPINAENLLMRGGMAPIPSYYSGLPGRLDDVNGERLMRMYSSLKARNGDDAATDFARMINDMPSLAGTNVVNAVIALGENNWEYDPDKTLERKTSEHPIDFTGSHGEAVMATSIGTYFGKFAADETNEIKQQFTELLEASRVETPQTPK